ncbi:MAG: phosphate acyltransferase PlsX [Clostridia bacterium]|nr:phosphate acyltransferase PlsX [Clostridia bacterium]
MRIFVDAFGGDNAPLAAIQGAADAVAKFGHTVVLCGDEQAIRACAEENGVSMNGIEICHTADVLTMDDEPKSILKEHKNSSMGVGLQALAAGEGDAFVTAGSSGAVLMGATFIVKRIAGVSRPAFASVLPSDTKPFLLLDMGANAECRPEMLLQFARMGALYMSQVIKQGETVTVGLLNNGVEEHKGGELQQQAYQLLKESELNFIGNVEARQVPFGAADVVVADGFSGNVLLKTMEGTADMLLKNIKQVFKTNLLTIIGGLLVKPYLGSLKKKMSASAHGGAPILGVRKTVIKAHGNADRVAFMNAIRVAAEAAEADIPARIAAAMATKTEGEA